jgi:carboxypeptidase C (cathepsin A)
MRLKLAMVMVMGAVVSTAVAQETLPAGGRGAPAAQTRPVEPRNDSVVTSGTLRPSGRPELTYTSIAGYLPLKDESDKLRANVFSVAYLAGASGPATVAATGPTVTAATQASPITGDARRPVTFIFNGGPGAAAVWLHLAVGPKRLDIPADGTAPAAPYRVVENEFSWLPATDMVFIDPVNTGYSRAATPELAREFFGVQEDISSVGEFIRLWLTRHQRWGSPVFIAGESYGTTRAAGLANYLQERVGVSVSGVVLISSVLNFATLSPGEQNDLPYALFLPSYTATAAYHRKIEAPRGLDALLKDAETFALGDYTVALARGAGLSEDDRQKVARRLAELTGLSPDYALQSNLRIPPARFEKELLRGTAAGPSKVIGRFDARLTGFSTDPVNDSQDYDPSLSGFYAAYASAFNTYARGTLKYENDLTYEVLSSRTQPWNYSSGGAGGSGGYLYVGDDLRDAMTRNPKLRLLVCSGRYDLATPYFAADYTLSHMTLAPEIRKNITHIYYPGGHMLYHVRQGGEKLYKDVTSFIEAK